MQSQNNVLELLVQKSLDHFIIFVDPDSRLLYRYYLNGSNHIRIETLEESKEDLAFKDKVEQRNKEILFKIRSLLVLDSFSWNFKEAEEYRRRPFPIKFL